MCERYKELCKELGINLNCEFTAEKQLKVIELLSEYDFNSWSYRLTEDSELEWKLTLEDSWVEGHGKNYGEALANLLINLYPHLLETKQQALVKVLEDDSEC